MVVSVPRLPRGRQAAPGSTVNRLFPLAFVRGLNYSPFRAQRQIPSLWRQPRVAISYDQGRSISYLLGGPNETINAFMTGRDEVGVFTAVSAGPTRRRGSNRWMPEK